MKKRDDVYLVEILNRIRAIRENLEGLSESKFKNSKLHQSAVIRDLQVIGEAAKHVSLEVREKAIEIPWLEIVGMRNRLTHEYFDVDLSVVWDVATKEILNLDGLVDKLLLETAPPSHSYRRCPMGYYWVREHNRIVVPSEKNPDGTTSVRDHCRRNPSGKDQLYPEEIQEITKILLEGYKTSNGIGSLDKPKNANDFDLLILGWVAYWSEVFPDKAPLDPNVVKALFYSESSFNLKVRPVRISKGNFARGPLQISDETRKVLADENGELRDHFLTATDKDVLDPSVALAASVRWLFHKKDLAEKKLGREASWEEAVAAYKGYLKGKSDWSKAKGMRNFVESLEVLRGSRK